MEPPDYFDPNRESEAEETARFLASCFDPPLSGTVEDARRLMGRDAALTARTAVSHLTPLQTCSCAVHSQLRQSRATCSKSWRVPCVPATHHVLNLCPPYPSSSTPQLERTWQGSMFDRNILFVLSQTSYPRYRPQNFGVVFRLRVLASTTVLRHRTQTAFVDVTRRPCP